MNKTQLNKSLIDILNNLSTGNIEINRQFLMRLIFIKLINRNNPNLSTININALKTLSEYNISFCSLYLPEFDSIDELDIEQMSIKLDSLFVDQNILFNPDESELFKPIINNNNIDDKKKTTKNKPIDIIRPDILSSLYEDLQDNQKNKGSFYTPIPIIKYMVEESIIHRLLSSYEKDLNVCNTTDNTIIDDTKNNSESIIEKQLRDYLLVDNSNSVTNNTNECHTTLDLKVLLFRIMSLTILEPCVGSGNFYIYMVNFLFNIYKKVTTDMGIKFDLQYLKHIYQYNLYAIDLDLNSLHILVMRIHLYNFTKTGKFQSVTFNLANKNTLLLGSGIESEGESNFFDTKWMEGSCLMKSNCK